MVLTVVEKPREPELQSSLCLVIWQVTSSLASIPSLVLVSVSVVL